MRDQPRAEGCNPFRIGWKHVEDSASNTHVTAALTLHSAQQGKQEEGEKQIQHQGKTSQNTIPQDDRREGEQESESRREQRGPICAMKRASHIFMGGQKADDNPEDKDSQ